MEYRVPTVNLDEYEQAADDSREYGRDACVAARG